MLKKNLLKLDIYFPILFKLKDDSEIIHSDLLKHIENKLLESSHTNQALYIEFDKIKEFPYLVNSSFLEPILADDPLIESLVIRAFYYHHRLIFHAHIIYRSADYSFRTIRMKMIDLMRDFSNTTVLQINHVIDQAKIDFMNHKNYKDIIANLSEVKIKTFYSYCVVFQPTNRGFLNKNDQIQTFNIRTLQPKTIPLNRTSLLRISIPNMTAYYSGKLSTEYKSEIINTIYKICLYEKKTNELNITKKYEDYNYQVTEKHQVITEKMILDMWSYCLDAFGGKRTDQIGNKGAVIGLIFSLIAFVFSIISLIQSIF